MAHDQGLAQRVRELLDGHDDIVEKKMFGGLAWMARGNLACGVHKESLIVRVGPARYDEALAAPHARVFDISGRPMKGWVMVDAGGYEADDDLRRWLGQGLDFTRSLPAK